MPAPEISIRQTVPRPWNGGIWGGVAVACVAGLGIWLAAASQDQAYDVGETSQGVLEWSIDREMVEAPPGATISKIVAPTGAMLSEGQPVALLDWSKARREQLRDDWRLGILRQAALCLGNGPYSRFGVETVLNPLEEIGAPPPAGCGKLDMTLLAQIDQNKRQILALRQQYRLVTRASNLILRDISQADGAATGPDDLAKSLETHLKRADAIARLNRQAGPLLVQWLALETDRKAQFRAVSVAIASLRHKIHQRQSMMSDPYLRAASVGVLDMGDPGNDEQSISIRGHARFGLVLPKPFSAGNHARDQDSMVINLVDTPHILGVSGQSFRAAGVSHARVASNGVTHYDLSIATPEQSASLLARGDAPGPDGVTRAGVRVAYLAKAPNIIAAAKVALCSYRGTALNTFCEAPFYAKSGKVIN